MAAEQTDAPHTVMEAVLAHTIPNSTEAAYARSDLFDKRRELLARWALGRFGCATDLWSVTTNLALAMAALLERQLCRRRCRW